MRMILSLGVHVPWVLESLRACLHGVGDPGLVGLVSFVFTLWGHKTKETYPTRPGSPTPCKQGLSVLIFGLVFIHVF